MGAEMEHLQTHAQKQEESILKMKKQIQAYRREIIDLSSTKKGHGGGGSGHHGHHQNSKSEGRRVPRLDLSKLHRDSEEGGEGDESCVSMQDGALDEENGKNVTYQQYLKFLENEKDFDGEHHQKKDRMPPNQRQPSD